MEIMVFGAGYVGLVTGAGLASTGNHVSIVDATLQKIKFLKEGRIPFFEPGLPDLIAKCLKQKTIDFIHLDDKNFQKQIETAEIYLIAVGTPEKENGETNLEYVMNVVDRIAQQDSDLNSKIVVTKSTVPVGTGDLIEKRFSGHGKRPKVVSNPEFLKQGAAVQDFLKPERVILGTDDQSAKEILSFLYHPFMLKRDRIVTMSRRSAELVKYACNTYLAMRISFINELSQLAEKVNADIREIREGMISDSRIGDQFLFPGIGYGGSCFPKDVHSLIVQGELSGLPLKLATAADQVNMRQRQWPFEKLSKKLGNLKGKVICLWGLSFKANTDDLREAPSITLIESLVKAGAHIRAYDPQASDGAKKIFESAVQAGQLEILNDPYDAALQADALVLMTEWTEFRTPNFKRLQELMKNPLIIDGRNIYDTKVVQRYGFDYAGVGVPSSTR